MKHWIISVARLVRKNQGRLLIAMLALTIMLGMGAPLSADYSDSPTNYMPAVSDVFVCNNAQSSVSVLNGVSGALIRTIALPAGARPFGIAFRPNYASAYVTDNANPRIYQISATGLGATIPAPTVNVAIAMHPSGSFAYLSSSSQISVLDTTPGSATFNHIIKKVSGMTGADSVVFTPDGTRAYLSVDGGYGNVSQIQVVNTANHTRVATIQLPIPTAPLGMAATPDGSRIYVAGWVAHNVTVIDSNPASRTYNTVLARIPVSGEARGIALSPSGNLAYVTLDTGGVDVIITTPSSNRFNQVISHITNAGPYGGIHAVATSLDGRYEFVSVANTGQSSVYVIDAEPFSATFNSVIKTLTVGSVPLGVAVRPHQ